MVSAAQLAWEERMREHGYVPTRERVANAIKGIREGITGTYRFGAKVCKGVYSGGKKVCKGIYSGGKKVYKFGTKAYAVVAPKAKEAYQEVQRIRAENAEIDKFAEASRKSKKRLDAIVRDIKTQRSPDCDVEIKDINVKCRDYGNIYEAVWSRINSAGREVPTGLMIDRKNKEFYRY